MRLNKRMFLGSVGLAAASLTLGAAPALAAAGGNGKAAAANRAYIVQMADMPVTAYAGGIAGYAATKPGKGQKIDPNASAVIKYKGYLAGKQDAALRAAGGGKKLYNYGYVFNGFAAELTEAQVAKLRQMPGVIAVTKDELQSATTSSTPNFLGLDAPGGIWSQAKGEGVIIGIIDSGIWPEHPSFSDRTDVNGNATKDGKLGYQQIPGWHGKCVPGENFAASHCNQKLIGAQYFNAAWGGNAAINAQRPWEFNSPRDYNGHGTHTASTSGGNANVMPTGPAAALGAVSGIAPRARIASYKALWSTQSGDTANGFTTDLVAAIDQAVADGVDVINYSISGTATNLRDAAQISFLFAADAGIFVAASAGNSGPTSGTVAHPSPWLTTVAAGTHNRNGEGSATLGNGLTYSGASLATPVTGQPVINSVNAGLTGADPSQVALCFSSADGGAVLDPAKVAGKIVVCDRGVTARVNKSLAVKEAGGVGMILANTSVNSLNADFHSVPTVHVQSTDRAAVMAYAATAGATATINAATIVYNAPAPFTASFSSRGPSSAAGGDLLKPDIIAPGQDILAGVAPPTAGGQLFNLLSGTSMSSPHIAGIAALFKELHPGWSPMAIKSALMTTASDIVDGGVPAPNTNPVLIFRQGAGHVRPNSAMSPGLVYDAGFADWLSFLCGAQPGGGCTGVTPMDPSDLNLASIAVNGMPGSQTVTRKLKNVSGAALTVTPVVTGLSGFDVAVSPTSLTLQPGQEKPFTLTLLRTSATLNAFTGGQLTWSSTSGVVVRSPVVVRPVALEAPTSVNAAAGGASYNVKFGFSGTFTATARGLVAAAVTAGTVADDPTDGACSLTAPNAQLIPVTIPAGTTHARFALFDADVNAGSDIDLCVVNSSGAVVGSSGSGTSAEEVNLISPVDGTYTVVVQGWGVAGSSPFKLHTWLLGSAAAGNMTVSAPAAATTGATGAINLSFSGLTAGQKYLGSVAYGGATGLPNPTIVRVDP